MPHLNGIALTGQLSEVIGADDYVPIIVLTADTTPEAKSRVRSAGAHDFLTKPFDMANSFFASGICWHPMASTVRL
jgi:putative two-component system response regulator